MNHGDNPPASASERLTDKQLFRQLCYVNGRWIGAEDGQTIDVDNPATGEIIGTVPKLGTGRRQPGDRRRCARA